MKRVTQGFLLITMVLLASIIWAGDITDTSLDKLMSLSGANKQLAEIPGMLRMIMEQTRQQDGIPISDEEFENLVKFMVDTFQPSEILSAMRMEIRNDLSESEAKGLIAWHESDLGKRITKAENEASTPAGVQNFIREAQSLAADEERMGIARRFLTLSNTVDMLLQLQEKTALAVITFFSKINNPDKPVNVEAFKAQISAQQQQTRGPLEQQLAVFGAYVYKDIDINSLEKYIEFLGLPNTKKFINSGTKGIFDGFAKCNEKMLKISEDLIEKKRKASKQIMLPTTLTE